MYHNYDEHFSLLQSLKAELSTYESKDESIQDLINEELKDVNTAISKWNNGIYGICEHSGETIPKELLESIPTLKTYDEWDRLSSFGKMTIPFSY